MVGDRFIVHSDTEGAMKLRPFLRPLCGGRTGLTTGIKKGAGAGGYGQVPSPRDSDRFRRGQLHRRVLRLRMVFGSESIPVPAQKLRLLRLLNVLEELLVLRLGLFGGELTRMNQDAEAEGL